MKNFNQVVQQFQDVNYEFNPHRKNSHIILFKEFLRRSIIFLQEINMADKYIHLHLPSLLVPGITNLNGDIKTLSIKYTHSQPFSLAFSLLLDGAIDWAYIEETNTYSLLKNIPNPYEPIFLLYKRGGYARELLHHRRIVVPDEIGRSFAKSSFDDINQSEPFTNLSEEDLDAIDENSQ